MLNALIVCCLLGQAPVLPEGSEVKYDKFADSTDIRLCVGGFTTDTGFYYFDIFTSHEGRDPKTAGLVVFNIVHYGTSWGYLESHDVVIMCGNKRLKNQQLYKPRVNTKNDPYICQEGFHIVIDPKDIQDILELNKDLEVKIGTHDPFTIGPKSRDKMLRFVKAVRSGAY